VTCEVDDTGTDTDWTISGTDMYSGVSGNVGVGTDSPAYSLDIAGHARVQGPDGFNSAGETAITYYGDGNHYIQGIYAEGINVNLHSGANDPITFSFSGSEKMRITYTGNVGIGETSPSEKLYVAGNIYATGNVTWGSSRELKEDIRELSVNEALSALNDLSPKKHYYKADGKDEHVGFIAEEVPELLATEDRKSLDPMDIVGVLVTVIQEQQKTIDSQNKINKIQQTSINDLLDKVDALQEEMKLMNSMAKTDIH
jgi:hypothetical protein